jgi:hypothetical protein
LNSSLTSGRLAELQQLEIRCDQLKNKSSRRVTYGNPCYSIDSKTNSIYFLNDRSVQLRVEMANFIIKHQILGKRKFNVESKNYI